MVPILATPTFLMSLRSIPHLPAHSWYYLASVAFALLNRPAEIPHIYAYATPNYDSVTVLNHTREALLKASAIGGLPSTINALNALKTVVAEELLDQPTLSHRQEGALNLEEGDRLWDSIYGKVGPRVMRGMKRSYDDLGIVARMLYAGVLADEGVLGKRETGYVLVTGLVTGGEAWAAQRKGHRRGCVNNGATWEEVEAVETLAGKVVEEVRNSLGKEIVGREA